MKDQGGYAWYARNDIADHRLSPLSNHSVYPLPLPGSLFPEWDDSHTKWTNRRILQFLDKNL